MLDRIYSHTAHNGDLPDLDLTQNPRILSEPTLMHGEFTADVDRASFTHKMVGEKGRCTPCYKAKKGPVSFLFNFIDL
jgi:hypothetical protein